MADVDNRNRNRRSNRAGQPNPKREARAKAAERHVAAVSEACAKDIERSLAGVREFDGMPAGFVAAMKAKAQKAAVAEEQAAEVVEADAAEVKAAEVETAVEPEVALESTELADELSPRPRRRLLRPCPRSLCLMPPPRRQSSITAAAMRSSAIWLCLPLPRLPIRAAAISRATWARRPRCAPIRTCTTYSTSSVSGTVRTVAATSTASCTVIVRWWCPRCASTATMCTPMPT